MLQEAFLQHILEAGSKGFHVRTRERSEFNLPRSTVRSGEPSLLL